MVLDITVTIPGLLGLVELNDFASAHNLEVSFKLVHGSLPRIQALSPQSLPEKLRNEMIDSVCGSLSKKSSIHHFLEALKKSKPTPISLKTRRQGKLELEKHFGVGGFEKIYRQNPNMLAWWYGLN